MLVYYMDVSNLDINQAQFSVSRDRLIKTDRFFHHKDKKLSIGAELLLKHTLSQIEIYDPVFCDDENGKPFLANYPDVHFNLSHSEKYVACAVSDSPVGVDIEYIHEVDLNIAKHYFFGSEYEDIANSSDKKKAFFEFWVLKESYMKMTGLGFRLALDEFSIEKSDTIRVFHEENNPKQEQTQQKQHPNQQQNKQKQHPNRQLNEQKHLRIQKQNTKKDYQFGMWNVGEGEYMLAVCSKSKVIKPDLILLQNITGEFMQKGNNLPQEGC